MLNKHKNIQNTKSILYIVSTPIGNLQDITLRTLTIFNKVNIIATEDTLRLTVLLKHFNIKTNAFLCSFNNFNERKKTNFLLKELISGKNVALVSNAGTPLINDPGYYLVHLSHKLGIRIVPLPGACAVITALSVSGLSCSRFCFEGFLPVKTELRKKYLKSLYYESRTMIFFESTHRLLDSLNDMMIVFGHYRYISLSRELTKIWESIYYDTIGKLLELIQNNTIQTKGELVLIVKGYKIKSNTLTTKIINSFKFLLTEVSFKKAIILTSKIFNINKKILYKYYIQDIQDKGVN